MATKQNYSWPSSSDVVITGVGNPTGQPVPADAVYVAGEDPSGNLMGLHTDSSGNLLVSLAAQPTSPLVTSDLADGSVTGGAAGSKSILIGARFNTVLPTLTNGQQAAAQLDSSARLILAPLTNASIIKAQLQDNAGNGITSQASGGQRALDVGIDVAGVQVDPRQIRALTSSDVVTAVSATAANLLTQVSQPTAANLNATVVQSSGSNLHVNVDNFPATQPVSGTVAVTQSTSPWVENLTQVGGSSIALGQTTMSASLPVAIASNQSAITVAQSTASNLKTQSFAGTPAALTITQAAISVGTSAVRLTVSGSAPSATRVVLVVTPDSASTAKFYIGSSSVANSGASRGIQIVAGQSFIANNDAGDYYIISDTTAQTVEVMEQA